MNWKSLFAGMVSLTIAGSVLGQDVDPGFLDPSHIKLQQYWGDALSKKYRFTVKEAPVRGVLTLIITHAGIAAHIYHTPDKTVTLRGNAMTLRELFWEIKQQTGCSFTLTDPFLVVGTKEE